MAKKLHMCGSESEMREVAARICRDFLHGAWKSVKPDELVFKRISGGLSNFLYYVALPDDVPRQRAGSNASDVADRELDPCDGKSVISRFLKRRAARCNSFNMEEPKKVLLRIYGQVHGERALDAIVTESVIFTLLSERKLGPKLHGVFSGGRIEEYIPARTLLTRELAEPALSMKIAEKMSAIHSMDVPLKKEPNWLWKTTGNWLKTVREERLNSDKVQSDHEKSLMHKLRAIDFEKELEWLKKYLSTVDSPVVFCHNDLQEGNILLLEDENPSVSYDETELTIDDSTKMEHSPRKSYLEMFRHQLSDEDANTSDSISSHISDSGEPRIVLIDFEYCAYNYRAFDIANHFQEWMYDYTNPEYPYYYESFDNLPSLEQKEIFIKQYLKHTMQAMSEDPKSDCTPSIEDINDLLNEVEAFTLASHLLWTLWSIVNATKSQIPFGYWDYAMSRAEMYLRLKQEVIKKEKYGYPQKRKIEEVDI